MNLNGSPRADLSGRSLSVPELYRELGLGRGSHDIGQSQDIQGALNCNQQVCVLFVCFSVLNTIIILCTIFV